MMILKQSKNITNSSNFISSHHFEFLKRSIFHMDSVLLHNADFSTKKQKDLVDNEVCC